MLEGCLHWFFFFFVLLDIGDSVLFCSCVTRRFLVYIYSFVLDIFAPGVILDRSFCFSLHFSTPFLYIHIHIRAWEVVLIHNNQHHI